MIVYPVCALDGAAGHVEEQRKLASLYEKIMSGHLTAAEEDEMLHLESRLFSDRAEATR